ncbi:MAG: nucleotide disphospho-sugar-binding domain-containing protein [Bacteroidota bacterium]
MADLLITITGLTGITNASLELGRRLQAAGHTVTLAAPRDLGERVEAAGFTFLQLPLIDERTEVLASREAALARTDPTAFVAELDARKPDLLLCDVELHEYIITAWGRKQNLLLLSQWYSLWDRPGLPYLRHATIPGKGFAGSRLGMWLSWQRIKFDRWRMHRRRALRFGGKERRSVLLALAKREDFPRRFIRKSFWPGPFTYSELPVMALAPYEMEFPHVPRPDLHYAGPMVRTDRPEAELPALADIFTRQKNTGAKLLLCTLTTMAGPADDFLDRLVAAVADRDDWLLIIGQGGANGPSILRPRPQNVFAFPYVPQLQVLAKADLSINHGGIHTIHECIHFGVPMLVYSGKKSDQNGCAARVHYHGLGLMADRDVDGADTIRAKIDRVLTTPAFSDSVRKMRATCTAYQEEKVAEKIIATWLSSA